MLGMIILFIVFAGIGNFFQDRGQKTAGNIFIILFVFLTYYAVVFFNRKVNQLSPDCYGFHFRYFGRNLLVGIVLALLLTSFALVFATAFYDIPIVFDGLKKGFVKPLYELILTVTLIGFWEEFFFRGLIYNTLLRNNFGFHLSALISSVLFSILHWSSYDMTQTSWFWYIGIVFIGYLLAFIYTITGSIWSVASFHFMWNFVAALSIDQENEIGLIKFSNYTEYSKTFDNIVVVILGIALVIMLLLSRQKLILDKVNLYVIKITTANKTQNHTQNRG